MNTGRLAVLLAGVTGFLGVVLAAVGAHALPGMDDFSTYRAWQSASTLNLVHSLLLLIVGIRLLRRPSPLLSVGAGLLFLGIVLFSGSIYVRIAFELERTFNLAPTGGLLLMTAWVVVAIGLLRD